MIVTTAVTLAGLTFAAKNLKDLGVTGFVKGVTSGIKDGWAKQKAKKTSENDERIAAAVVKGLLNNASEADKQAILRTLNKASEQEKAA